MRQGGWSVKRFEQLPTKKMIVLEMQDYLCCSAFTGYVTHLLGMFMHEVDVQKISLNNRMNVLEQEKI